VLVRHSNGTRFRRLSLVVFKAAGLDLRDQHLIGRTLISLIASLIQSEPKTRLSRQTEAFKRCAGESTTDIRLDD
jgi:hypothetical protein